MSSMFGPGAGGDQDEDEDDEEESFVAAPKGDEQMESLVSHMSHLGVEQGLLWTMRTFIEKT